MDKICPNRKYCKYLYYQNCKDLHPDEDYLELKEILETIPCRSGQKCSKNMCRFLHEDSLIDELSLSLRHSKIKTLNEINQQIISLFLDLDHSKLVNFSDYEELDEDPLGFGSTGVVIKTKNRETGEIVACKIMNKVIGIQNIQQRISEINIIKKLNNPNLVKFVGFDYTRESRLTYTFYIFTELAHGDLKQFRDKNPSYFNNVDNFNSFFKDMIETIHYLGCKNIVHRDIKPENILYFESAIGGKYIFKLCDYGFSKNNTSTISKIVGSEGFMAPEIANLSLSETKSVDLFKSDAYSLGMIFLNILDVGKKDEDLRQKIQSKLTDSTSNHIMDLIDDDINKRSSCTDVYNKLNRLMSIKKVGSTVSLSSDNFGFSLLNKNKEQLMNLGNITTLRIYFNYGNNSMDSLSFILLTKIISKMPFLNEFRLELLGGNHRLKDEDFKFFSYELAELKELRNIYIDGKIHGITDDSLQYLFTLLCNYGNLEKIRINLNSNASVFKGTYFYMLEDVQRNAKNLKEFDLGFNWLTILPENLIKMNQVLNKVVDLNLRLELGGIYYKFDDNHFANICLIIRNLNNSKSLILDFYENHLINNEFEECFSSLSCLESFYIKNYKNLTTILKSFRKCDLLKTVEIEVESWTNINNKEYVEYLSNLSEIVNLENLVFCVTSNLSVSDFTNMAKYFDKFKNLRKLKLSLPKIESGFDVFCTALGKLGKLEMLSLTITNWDQKISYEDFFCSLLSSIIKMSNLIKLELYIYYVYKDELKKKYEDEYKNFMVSLTQLNKLRYLKVKDQSHISENVLSEIKLSFAHKLKECVLVLE